MKETGSLNTVADLTWDQVARRLAAGAPAILPIGAGAKQHGLHMTMATDQVFAEYLAGVLAEKIDALIWPTLTYGAYPAFVAYAGSASLSDATFQAVVTEIAGGLLGFGARRVLVLDTGLSTIAPIEAAIHAASDPSRLRHLKVFAGPRFVQTVPSSRAALRQPCRRDRDLADAGDRARTGRHVAGRALPVLAYGAIARAALTRRPDIAQLFAERQFRRSDTRLGREGPECSCCHPSRLTRGGSVTHANAKCPRLS
jgi:hypothetical protein